MASSVHSYELIRKPANKSMASSVHHYEVIRKPGMKPGIEAVHDYEVIRKPAIESIPCTYRTRSNPPVGHKGPLRVHDVAWFKTVKHVEFTTLLKWITRDDPLVRIDGFKGIQDYIEVGEYSWTGDKLEKTMFKKLCKGITDTHDGVREAAYELLKMVKGFQNFEDYVPTLLVPSVMKALAHAEMGVHLTGKKVYDLLVRRIPSCFHLFVRKAIQTLEDMTKNGGYEQQGSHLHMLRIFQTVNVCLSSMPSSDQCCEILFDKKSLGVLQSVLSAFPMDSEHFDIDIEVTKIFLRLPKLTDSEKFLAFINDKLRKIPESNLEELLAFFPPYVPMLVTGLGSNSQANLIQAFTVGFKRSRPDSEFKSACAAAIEQMLSGSYVQDVNCELFQLSKREWLDELRASPMNLKKHLPLVMSILMSSGDSE